MCHKLARNYASMHNGMPSTIKLLLSHYLSYRKYFKTCFANHHYQTCLPELQQRFFEDTGEGFVKNLLSAGQNSDTAWGFIIWFGAVMHVTN